MLQLDKLKSFFLASSLPLTIPEHGNASPAFLISQMRDNVANVHFCRQRVTAS
jgi:hypothetical protein